MFTHSEDRFAGMCGRRVGLLAAVAAALSAAALVDASGASALTFVHSAKSGELRGGRLILYGVGGRVSYTTRSGRTGTAALRHLHKGVFLPGRPATGVLHVAGHRGGDEPSFRLSNPRYNAARRTLSFSAKRLDRKRLPGRANATGTAQTPLLHRTTAAYMAAAQARSFGPASLTVTPHAMVARAESEYGNECEAIIQNRTTDFKALWPSAQSAWDTDHWGRNPPPVDPGHDGDWYTVGGVSRGCHNSVTWTWLPDGPYTFPDTFTIDVTWPWGQLPSSTCTPANSTYRCERRDHDGTIVWAIVPG